jgi:hypothetical protein
LDSGEVLAVVESDTVNHVVTVERFSPDGDAASVDLRLAGYKQPSIATGPTGAWLLMVRSSDGYVVSRELSDSGWTEVDRVELGAAGGGNYSWPNALRRVDGRLRFVVRGPAGGSAQNSVLAFQRVV